MKGNHKLNKEYVTRIFLLVVFIVTLMLMRSNEVKFKLYGSDIHILDMRFGYQVNDVTALFQTLGEEGRSIYQYNLWIDFVFIISLAFLQNYILKWIMGKQLRNTNLRWLLSTSYFRALFDLLENILIFIMLYHFPLNINNLAKLSSYITRIKFLWMGAWLCSLLIILALRLYRKKRKKGDQ